MDNLDIIEDVKILNSANDMYGSKEKADAIVELISLDENKELLAKNNLIAVYGKWGTGKSSILKTVEQNLDSRKFKTVWFDTWKNEKDKNLPYSLLKYIIKDSLSTKVKEKALDFLENGYDLLKSFCNGIDLNVNFNPTEYGSASIGLYPGQMIESIERELDKNEKEKEVSMCLWEKIGDFEKKFSKIKFGRKRLIVILDDLDRCESENIISLLSSIKLLLSCNPNIIFLLGIDKEAVTLALQNKYNNNYNKANEYLEKLFPVNFSISNKLDERKLCEYIHTITGLNVSKSQIIYEFLKQVKFNNPRHLKKILRKYYIIKNNLWKNGIDIENPYEVIFVLYFIILNNFFGDEYECIVNKEKSRAYQNIKLQENFGNNQHNFFTYNALDKVMYHRVEDSKYEIFKLVEVLSPNYLINNTIKANRETNSSILISLDDWLVNFSNSICTNFIEATVSDKNFLETFSDKDKKCDINKIKKIINITDRLM